MSDLEHKRRFAELLLKSPGDPFPCANALFPGNVQRAMHAAMNWPADPEVIAFMDDMEGEKGEMGFLPTKGDLGRLVWDMAKDTKLEVEDRIKAAKLYAEIRGFVEKPSTGPVVNISQNRVMVIESHGSDDEWSAALAQQQRTLKDVTTH